jgi:oligopeptide transport system substrate-binding protein
MRRVIFYLIVFGILLQSCTSSFDYPAGETVFRYNESAGISSLDPAFARDQANIWACNQLYNGLVQLDDQLRVQPSIAKNWTISENGLDYIFNLREDIYFHDWEGFPNGIGRKLIANDVVYSLQRVLRRETLSPGAVWLSEVILMETDGNYSIKIINDSTIKISLKKPFSAFLSRLSMQYFSIVPHEAIKFYGDDFGRNPVGTGPFYFKMMKEGVKMVLLKNPKYFETENGQHLPYLDAVAISFIIDKQSVFLEFIKGNLDFLSGIDPSYKDELLQSDGNLNNKYQSKLNIFRKPYLNTEYFGFLIDTTLLSKNTPTEIKKIRQAINYGFDRQKMMRYLRNNVGISGENGFVPPGMPGFDKIKTKGYYYNPELAQKLLEEAGYPQGKGLPAIHIATTASYVDIGKYIQQQMSKIGIRIEVDIHQPAALRQMVANGKIPFFRGSWIADYADAENYLALFYSKNFCPNGANYTHFSNAKFDYIYEKAISETNDSLRLSMYFTLDSIIVEEAPFVVLYYDEVLRFTQKNISGLGVNSMNLLDLKRVKKVETNSSQTQ